DGDLIELDLEAGTLELCVDPAELARRAEGWTPPTPRFASGWLGRYTRMATSASTGAVLRADPAG
ncbi:MAG TPA: dihydroxy-acid dehydratase, partial [Armatimonadetes bacterium]|nr:dihydroxy-acid dehydratase [Armatimonadota bacterium]